MYLNSSEFPGQFKPKVSSLCHMQVSEGCAEGGGGAGPGGDEPGRPKTKVLHLLAWVNH